MLSLNWLCQQNRKEHFSHDSFYAVVDHFYIKNFSMFFILKCPTKNLRNLNPYFSSRFHSRLLAWKWWASKIPRGFLPPSSLHQKVPLFVIKDFFHWMDGGAFAVFFVCSKGRLRKRYKEIMTEIVCERVCLCVCLLVCVC